MMNRLLPTSLVSGLAGALVLTAVHEVARRQLSDAPRMDVLGMRALRRYVPGLEHERPRSSRLHRLALAGDIVANAAYYAAVPGATAARTWTRAATLGLAAGVGALALPRRLGLGDPPNAGTPANRVMTVAWYLAGALASAAMARALAPGSAASR